VAADNMLCSQSQYTNRQKIQKYMYTQKTNSKNSVWTKEVHNTYKLYDYDSVPDTAVCRLIVTEIFTVENGRTCSRMIVEMYGSSLKLEL